MAGKIVVLAAEADIGIECVANVDEVLRSGGHLGVDSTFLPEVFAERLVDALRDDLQHRLLP